MITKDLKNIENEFVRDHIQALAWMVANGMLEIRVAFVLDDKGNPLDKESINGHRIFHQKVGILEDEYGNKLSFSGSDNESASGWRYHIEEFKVFRGWIDGQREYLGADIQKFENFWNGGSKRTITMSIPEAAKKELLHFAPQSLEELNIERWNESHLSGRSRPFNPKRLKPWNHQIRALEKLKQNNYSGILKMATGTGKTAIALFALEHYLKEKKRFGNCILILVPTKEIGKQWKEFLRSNTGSGDVVSRYDSSVSGDEKTDMARAWRGMLNDTKTNLFQIITVQSLKNFEFYGNKIDFLIGDEVHRYGTRERMEVIKKNVGNPENVLGISASPERYYDPEGTERIKAYFGSIIFEYGIEEAQKEKKAPGRETVLAQYYYYPYIVELTPKEEEKVLKYSKEIGRQIAMTYEEELSESNTLPESVKTSMNKRAKINKR